MVESLTPHLFPLAMKLGFISLDTRTIGISDISLQNPVVKCEVNYMTDLGLGVL
jgi:hypothetical protein